MKFLFFHPNFPGQFIALAPELVKRGHDVVALSRGVKAVTRVNGVRVIPITSTPNKPGSDTHRWAQDFEREVILAEAAYLTAKQIKTAGFSPDIMFVHPGWGDTTCLKQVWPDAKLVLYCEEYLAKKTAEDAGGDEFLPKDEDFDCLIQMAGAKWLMHFAIADAGLSPTHYQASRFPGWFRPKIEVIHDGIDTRRIKPTEDATISISRDYGTVDLTKTDQVITYVSRNFEPTRGYHTFIQALPSILKNNPHAHVLIIGGKGEGYGAKLNSGEEWRDFYLAQIIPQVPADDWRRVHFLGALPYSQYITALQISTVHIYLTVPTMLSWSLMEAMAVGCSIIGSDTPPVQEVITHDENGYLVPFNGSEELAHAVTQLIGDDARRERYGLAARKHMERNYDLTSNILPAQIAWLEGLVNKSG